LIELSFCYSLLSFSFCITEFTLKSFGHILLGVILLCKSCLHEPLTCEYYLHLQIQACPFIHRHDDDDDKDDDDDDDNNNNNNKFLCY
jgi:hypothetical protein